MQPLRWERRPDGLRAPALVCAFKGWNDAGESATSALSFLGSGLGASRFAVIDPEEFVDFQATRPTVRISEGQHRTIEWPDIEVHELRIPRAPRDLVLLSGPEPAYRWRTFCATVIELAEALGVQPGAHEGQRGRGGLPRVVPALEGTHQSGRPEPGWTVVPAQRLHERFTVAGPARRLGAGSPAGRRARGVRRRPCPAGRRARGVRRRPGRPSARPCRPPPPP